MNLTLVDVDAVYMKTIIYKTFECNLLKGDYLTSLFSKRKREGCGVIYISYFQFDLYSLIFIKLLLSFPRNLRRTSRIHRRFEIPPSSVRLGHPQAALTCVTPISD